MTKLAIGTTHDRRGQIIFSTFFGGKSCASDILPVMSLTGPGVQGNQLSLYYINGH